MTYINYKDMRQAIRNHETFKGNSVTGFTTKAIYDGVLMEVYKIQSYNTTILECVIGDRIIFNNRRYSVTTSKLQNLIIDTLGLSDSKKR